MSPNEYNRRFANIEMSLSVKLQNALSDALSSPCYICSKPRKLIIGFVPNRPTYLHPYRCDLCAEADGLRPIDPYIPAA